MFNKTDKKHLLVFSCISFLFFYPLIQAGIFYRDDLDRAITGQYGWRSLGRPVADLLMRVLSASGRDNLDLFPYTMIFSSLLIATAAVFLKKHLEGKNIRHAPFAACMIIFNPFMLQNIAYRFDSLGMALAMLLAVISYTWVNDRLHPWVERLVKISAGILSLSLYQPCANIFIGLIAIDLAILCTEKKPDNPIKYISNKILDFFLFYILYVLLVAKVWKHNNTRATTISPDLQGLETVTHTIHELITMVASFFYGPVAIYFIIPLVIAIPATLYRIIKNKNSSLLKLSFLFLSFFLIFISLLGPNIILNEAPIFPRIIISFSCLIVIIAILLGTIGKYTHYLTLIPVITIFSFSAQLTNAMKSQREHENSVFTMLSYDLHKAGSLKEITITGQVNINERTKILLINKPLINYFLSPASDFIASYLLINEGFPQTTRGYDKAQIDRVIQAEETEKRLKPIISNQEYSIYLDDNKAVVKLGNDKSL